MNDPADDSTDEGGTGRAGDRWRILTWNVHGSARPDLMAIARTLREQHPDAVALQELQRRQAQALARELGWSARWARKHHPYTPLLWWRAEGLAILTPHALDDVRRRSLTPGVSTWTFRHRIVLAATIVQHDGRRLRLYDTHLASHDAPDDRIAQAAGVAAIVIDDGAGLRIVAGDLNASDEVEVIRELHRAGLRDPGGSPTHPSIAPRRRLDYVLVPEGTAVTERGEFDGGADWWELSDHLPVLVEFL